MLSHLKLNGESNYNPFICLSIIITYSSQYCVVLILIVSTCDFNLFQCAYSQYDMKQNPTDDLYIKITTAKNLL